MNPIPVVAVSVLVAVLIGGTAFHYGKQSGESAVQSKWNQEKQETAEEVNRLQAVISNQEEKHRIENGTINKRLTDAKTTYDSELARLSGVYAQRLRDSQSRTQVYQRLAEGGATERDRLASHAAELDRSLEQGRQLVGELRITLGQRDEQIRALSQQIVNDRNLFSNAGSNDSTRTIRKP